MPTGRAYTFLIAGVMLYFFGNQSQVGWLYVMSGLLLGTLIAAFFLNLRSVSGIRFERRLNGQKYLDLYEGDPIEIQLLISNRSRFPVVQIQLVENCPLDDPFQREKRIFVPTLSGHSSLAYVYQVEVYRRGIYQFPPVKVISRAPFGFFQRQTLRQAESHVVVYPEVKKLKEFDLFDRQLASQMVFPRSGVGSEVIGVRPYRSGDSPRHIHWRSVARTGQLISKEFAEESRPGLSLVIDRLYPGDYETKQNAFEWAIKIAMSVADYAQERNYPLHLIADISDDLPIPGGAIVWDSLLQYSARVSPIKSKSLSELLIGRDLQTYVVVIIPWPDESIIEPLVSLKHRGYVVLPILLNPASFPVSGIDATAVGQLLIGEIDVNLIDFDVQGIHYASPAGFESFP